MQVNWPNAGTGRKPAAQRSQGCAAKIRTRTAAPRSVWTSKLDAFLQLGVPLTYFSTIPSCSSLSYFCLHLFATELGRPFYPRVFHSSPLLASLPYVESCVS